MDLHVLLAAGFDVSCWRIMCCYRHKFFQSFMEQNVVTRSLAKALDLLKEFFLYMSIKRRICLRAHWGLCVFISYRDLRFYVTGVIFIRRGVLTKFMKISLCYLRLKFPDWNLISYHYTTPTYCTNWFVQNVSKYFLSIRIVTFLTETQNHFFSFAISYELIFLWQIRIQNPLVSPKCNWYNDCARGWASPAAV